LGGHATPPEMSFHGDGVKNYSSFIITGLRYKVGRSVRPDTKEALGSRRLSSHQIKVLYELSTA
jgi:hypothetical protein